jgi:hypothetical protein
MMMDYVATEAQLKGVISAPPPPSMGPSRVHHGQGHNLFTSTHHR